ncbi:hypothetical protein [Pyxidicoccus trucidator]|uniref:hypothetical protein n=1 Tax=Pyxidicoccus trucidator TaxID=2709662 RepID=UPI0019682506|nr:hypothetical protein [Pyxidicoccus trucidator]
MRFNRFVVLPLALLALGALPACSNDDDDDNDNPDSGTSADAGTEDSGTVTFPDAGTDPGTSPAGTCPAGSIVCESFSSGLNGWESSGEHATIAAENGRLHIVTENGLDERNGQGQAIARWSRSIPAFGTQLFVRAHVFMRSLPGAFGQMGTFFVVSNLGSDFGGFELQVMQDKGFALDDWSFRQGQGWNRQPEPVTRGMEAGRWVCLEWEIRRPTAASTHGNTRVYVDGTLIHDFTNIGMRAFNTFNVGYGFVHPLGPSGSETFIDNVAVSSTQRIGCQ